MVDFSDILNDQLRWLVMASPAVISLNESLQTDMVKKMAAASPEKQQVIIGILEKEKANLAESEKAKLVEVDAQLAQLNEMMDRLNHIERQYSLAVAGYAEVKSQTDDQKVLGQLLDQLDKI